MMINEIKTLLNNNFVLNDNFIIGSVFKAKTEDVYHLKENCSKETVILKHVSFNIIISYLCQNCEKYLPDCFFTIYDGEPGSFILIEDVINKNIILQPNKASRFNTSILLRSFKEIVSSLETLKTQKVTSVNKLHSLLKEVNSFSFSDEKNFIFRKTVNFFNLTTDVQTEMFNILTKSYETYLKEGNDYDPLLSFLKSFTSNNKRFEPESMYLVFKDASFTENLRPFPSFETFSINSFYSYDENFLVASGEVLNILSSDAFYDFLIGGIEASIVKLPENYSNTLLETTMVLAMDKINEISSQKENVFSECLLLASHLS